MKASFHLFLLAFVAQWIEHLTTDQKVGGSSPSKRTKTRFLLTRAGFSRSSIVLEDGERAVAQLGSALVWGTRGRRFKSCQPDSLAYRLNHVLVDVLR